ncbi:MAG: bpX5 domain-containing protein [Archangium sp.]
MASPSSRDPHFSPAWSPRTEPLTALAVAGVGPVALALAHRVLAAEEGALARWSGVAGPGVLVLLGDTESLPWVDGAVYLGRDAAAPSLLLPCTLAPDVAPALLERALVTRAGAGTPLAVLPRSGHLVPVGAARPISRDTLSAWRAKQEAAP